MGGLPTDKSLHFYVLCRAPPGRVVCCLPSKEWPWELDAPVHPFDYNGGSYELRARGPSPRLISGRIFGASPLRLAFFFAIRKLIVAEQSEVAA